MQFSHQDKSSGAAERSFIGFSSSCHIALRYAECTLGKQIMEGRHCRLLFRGEGEWEKTEIYENILSKSMKDTSFALSHKRTGSPKDTRNYHKMFLHFS